MLLDRFVDSSLAYQGAGRSLGIEEIATLNAFATGGLAPDRTLLLRIDPITARSRQQSRMIAPDRLEQEDQDFFDAIAAAYDELRGRRSAAHPRPGRRRHARARSRARRRSACADLDLDSPRS